MTGSVGLRHGVEEAVWRWAGVKDRAACSGVPTARRRQEELRLGSQSVRPVGA